MTSPRLSSVLPSQLLMNTPVVVMNSWAMQAAQCSGAAGGLEQATTTARQQALHGSR
jgi:hypothetical protein